jgi:hypothetical protein
MTQNNENKTARTTGKYVYDAKLGKVVKVSDDIPGLKKNAQSSDSCPMAPGGHKCNGCCGH